MKIVEMDKLNEIMNEYLPHWEMSELHKSMVAVDYVEQFSVKDIEAFIEFCKENDMEDKITPTIAHDINGTYDDCFLPKTTGYYKGDK